jgi:hypothetical protein
MNELAPVVLFVYNRPHHTRQVLEALARNPEAANSILYIYADGPKSDAKALDREKINHVREVIRQKVWCGKVEIIECDHNQGLARSVIHGVTDIVNRHGRVIVLEDDIVPMPVFLSYMNMALDLYAADDRVMSISSYNFFAISSKIPDLFFLHLPDCWGWATWKRGWDFFEADAGVLIQEIQQKRELVNLFNFHGAYDYLDLLKKNANGAVDSWAIRWYASCIIHNRLSLYPKKSMVQNIGFDGSGVNSGLTDYSVRPRDLAISNPLIHVRAEVKNNEQAMHEFGLYFRERDRLRWSDRILNKVKAIKTILLKRS